jgi:hypothetical protein
VAFGPRRGYFLDLVRIEYLCLADGRSAGVHQRFEEHTGGGLLTVKVPLPDDSFDAVTIAVKSARVDRPEVDARYKAGWYRETWARFTTARQTRDGWNWLVTKNSVPDDLFAWLNPHGVPFSVRVDQEGAPLPAHSTPTR